VRYKGNAYYHVDCRDAIGGKYDAHCYTQTENIMQLRVTCSECIFTVFCGCNNNIIDLITAGLKMSNVRKHMKPCSLFV
jgi:hypothetical protein